MKELSHTDFVTRLKPVLSSMVNEIDGGVDWSNPLTPTLQHRLLLAPLSFSLPRSVFDAMAAESASFIFSSVPRFVDPVPIQMDWLLTRDDFEWYERISSDPVEQALYSLSGDWVIVSNDECAVLGARTAKLVERVTQVAGRLADPRTFVAYAAVAAEREGCELSESWMMDLLRHVVGESSAAKLIEGFSTSG